MGSMDNQNVVVIGGTSGIGLATAVTVARKGANVWAVSRSEDKVKACSGLYPEITFSSLDTHNVEGLKSLFESVGAIDHIVAAATAQKEQWHRSWNKPMSSFVRRSTNSGVTPMLPARAYHI